MIEGTVSLRCSRCNHCEVCQWVDLKMNGCDWFEEEPRTGWIPCSERLPEENGVYIISYEDAVTWLEWFNGKWFFYPSNPARVETGTIIAWMSLPERYKQEVEK